MAKVQTHAVITEMQRERLKFIFKRNSSIYSDESLTSSEYDYTEGKKHTTGHDKLNYC